MSIRLTSLRAWLLVAMLAAGALSLMAARFAIERIEHAGDERSDRAKDEEIVRTIAEQVANGARPTQLRAIQAVLPYERIVVFRGGDQIYAGPAFDSELELSVSETFPGGRVVLFDYHNPDPAISTDLTLVAAGSMLLVIVVAFLAATLLTRFLKAPIDRAAAAADRVARGDFSARLADVGPGEFAQLAHAFDSMAARLESSERDQKRFLSDIAHELATPVNAISGLAGAVVDGTITDLDERAEAARLITSETSRLETLLDDLRRLTDLDRNESVRCESVDLMKVARRAEMRFRREARNAGIDLDVRGVSVIVRTDESLIETIVDNFLTNALRYTPTGGDVEIRTERRDRAALIAVRDSGIGIAEEHIPRIFGRFYRVDAARDRHSGGGGLGLSLASQAASSIGGRIEVESELGSGSEFRLIVETQPPHAARARLDWR